MASDPLLLAALVMTVIGFGFKVAAAPFHLWAPDAYRRRADAQRGVDCLRLESGELFRFRAGDDGRVSRGAGGSGAWHHYAAGWLPVLALVAAASMLLGNLAAIAQSNVKRLLAYSAIAHAGYALLGLLANNARGAEFAGLLHGDLRVDGGGGVRRGGGGGGRERADARLADFAGLSRREPLISFCMMIFMLSLAGIPPLAGFFGKFYLFTAAAGGAKNLGLLWLVIFAVAMSAVSLYYYLQVLKQIYVVPAPADAPAAKSALTSRIMMALMALGVVALGCAPDLLVGRLMAAVEQFGF